MNTQRLSMSRYCVLLMFLSILLASCTGAGQPVLKPPAGSSGNKVPLYPNSHKLEVNDPDKVNLIKDVLSPSPKLLAYSSTTDISWTEDTGTKVQEKFDELLPDANWRIESDWVSHDKYYGSGWRNGDLYLLVVYSDNLNSEQINDLKRRYGISGPQPGSTLIISHLWDSTQPLPTATPTETPIPPPTSPPSPTPVPTSTFTPQPTSTPAPIPTAPPDTPPGTTLTPGDVWYQGGMEMRIKNSSFVPGCNGLLGFEMTIVNNTGGELVANISGLDISISDDQGQTYPEVWWSSGTSTEVCYRNHLNALKFRSMAPGQRLDLAMRVIGNLPQNVSRFTVTVYQAGRIQNAVWVIEVPR